jgi:lipooligosaccharide transport system permease protein
MALFAGVFFPLEGMPAAVRLGAGLLPLYHAVELVRPLMTGTPLSSPLVHLGVLGLYTVSAYWLAVRLIGRRLRA